MKSVSFFLSLAGVQVSVFYQLGGRILQLLDFLFVESLRYVEVVHGEAPESGAEVGRHVLPYLGIGLSGDQYFGRGHLGSEVWHHGVSHGAHHELGGLRVLGVLLSDRPLLPDFVSLAELVELGGDQVIKHRTCQEEGNVRVDVKL